LSVTGVANQVRLESILFQTNELVRHLIFNLEPELNPGCAIFIL